MTPFYGKDRQCGHHVVEMGVIVVVVVISTQRRGCATITSGILGIKAGLNKPHFLEKCPQSFSY